jgi:hypothetical protein
MVEEVFIEKKRQTNGQSSAIFLVSFSPPFFLVMGLPLNLKCAFTHEGRNEGKEKPFIVFTSHRQATQEKHRETAWQATRVGESHD